MFISDYILSTGGKIENCTDHSVDESAICISSNSSNSIGKKNVIGGNDAGEVDNGNKILVMSASRCTASGWSTWPTHMLEERERRTHVKMSC